jgi:hypothetical protein
MRFIIYASVPQRPTDIIFCTAQLLINASRERSWWYLLPEALCDDALHPPEEVGENFPGDACRLLG